MHPEIVLPLFGSELVLKSYAIFTVLGALTAAALAIPLLRRTGITVRRSLVLLALLAAGFLAGARLLNYLVNPGVYGQSLRLFTLRLAGFSLYGGLAGALSVLIIWLHLSRREAWPILDALTPPFAAGFALARLGCYFNGCCGGIATDSVLGVVFPSRVPTDSIISGVFELFGTPRITVYPTQLFELSLAVLGLIPVLAVHLRGKSPPGTMFLLYGVLFSAVRLAILPMRDLPYAEIVTKLVYPLIYTGAIIIGITLLLCGLKGKSKSSIKRTRRKT